MLVVVAGHSCWAADNRGQIQTLDVRTQKLQSSLKGAGGALRSISLHPSKPLLASVGLDRLFHAGVDDRVVGTKDSILHPLCKYANAGILTICIPDHRPRSTAGVEEERAEPGGL